MEEARQRMNPGNSLSGTGKIGGTQRTEVDGPQDSEITPEGVIKIMLCGKEKLPFRIFQCVLPVLLENKVQAQLGLNYPL